MKRILSLSLLFALPLLADIASAGSCQNAIREAQKKIFGDLGSVCADINTQNQENSPYIYVNPDGGCDLGLQLPGLPTFGGGLGSGLDMCALAKTVTGGMVSQANTAMQGSMNTAIGAINQTTQQTIGTGVVNGNVNISDILNQTTQQGINGSMNGEKVNSYGGNYGNNNY